MFISNLSILLLIALLSPITPKCAYWVKEDGHPVKTNKTTEEPHIVEGLTECVEYNGKLGCCDKNNDNSQIKSYVELDGVFSNQGGGCDVCSINQKRFWCEYACSPRQAEFMTASEKEYPVPDPKNPEEIVMVQKIVLTVNADTACKLYGSCKRVPFVSSVSAMSTPAGFLNFLGHNAVDDAFQYIDVKFSYNLNDSLYFNNDHIETEWERSEFTECSAKIPLNQKLHNFTFNKNCSCNNCEGSCEDNSGFIYEEPKVFEDFNYVRVLSVWGVSILIVGALTLIRKKQESKIKSH